MTRIGEFVATPDWTALLLGLAFAAGCGQTVPDPETACPHLIVDRQHEATIDVMESQAIKTFDLVNHGAQRLELGSVTTSCGCSSAQLSSKKLDPGGRTTLTLRGILPVAGMKVVRVEIPTSDSCHPVFELHWRMVSRAVPPKVLTASPSVHFGNFRTNAPPARRMLELKTLENRETPPICVACPLDSENLRLNGGLVDEEPSEDARFVHRTYRYEIGLISTPPIGPIVAQVDFARADQEGSVWFLVPVRGAVLPIVRSVPPTILLGGILTAQSKTTRFLILSEKESPPLEVEWVEHDPDLPVRIVRREASRVTCEVELGPVESGPTTRSLAFRVTGPTSTILRIPVTILPESH